MDTSSLQVSADRLIARLRDKLAEAVLQNALLEAAVEEAGIRQAETDHALAVAEADLAAFRQAAEGPGSEEDR